MSSGLRTKHDGVSLGIRKFEIDHNKANYLIFGENYYTAPLIGDIIKQTKSIVITNKARQKKYNQKTCVFHESYDVFSKALNEYVFALKNKGEYKNEHTYFVFDDCFYDDTWQSNRALIELMRDPDNIFNSSVIIATSHPYIHNHYITTNIDYTIILQDVCMKHMKYLYKTYFQTIDSYQFVKDLLIQLCSNREGCVVLINGTFGSLERYLKWYLLNSQPLLQ